MTTARYIFGLLLVIMLPPGLAWWFIIHPFVGFWRRVGARATMIFIAAFSVASMGGLWMIRRPLMGTDLGTHPVLWIPAALGVAGAIFIGVKRKRYLTTRILTGLPELAGPGGDRGELLSEGIYGVIRHPRYVEVTLGVFAYALFSCFTGPLIVALLTPALLHAIVILEERELATRFGEEYEAYRTNVPRYVPRPRRAAGT